MGKMAGLYSKDYINEESDYDVQCKYCKHRRLYWVELSNGTWRLATPTGKLHNCKAYFGAKLKINGETK